MIERKESQETSTIAEDIPSTKAREVKKFVTFQIKQKESKEKRKQICRKYREKKKSYLKELEACIFKLEQVLSQSSSQCDAPLNCINDVMKASLPQDIIAELFKESPNAFINFSCASETKAYLDMLTLKHSSIIKDFLNERDPMRKAMYKRLMLYANHLINSMNQLYNYYLHINTFNAL